MLLSERVAIVTGGGRGIGRAIALKLSSEGAAVVVAARSENEVRQVTGEIQKQGGQAIAVTADVSLEADCEAIVRKACEAFGAIHILVNNAAIPARILPIENVTPAEWDEIMTVNLRGPFLLSRLVLPEMYRQGSGAILNISSIVAKTAFPLNGPYAASKAGLIALTHTMAAEGGRKGVRVNAICPGPVTETRMLQESGRELAEYYQIPAEELLANFLKLVLQGKPQTTEDIASAALFLVSRHASAITGQTLNVDGGTVFY